VSLLLRYDTTR